MPNGNLNSYLNRTDVTLAMNTRLCIVSFNYETHCKSLLYYQQLKQITEGLKYRE